MWPAGVGLAGRTRSQEPRLGASHSYKGHPRLAVQADSVCMPCHGGLASEPQLHRHTTMVGGSKRDVQKPPSVLVEQVHAKRRMCSQAVAWSHPHRVLPPPRGSRSTGDPSPWAPSK